MEGEENGEDEINEEGGEDELEEDLDGEKGDTVDLDFELKRKKSLQQLKKQASI